MNQHNELSDDIEGVRVSLYQSACRAIWHYYRITKTINITRGNRPRRGNHDIEIPDQHDMKYPATLTQLLQIIEPLLRLPIVDLLSVKMNLSQMTELFPGCGNYFMRFLNNISILQWAAYLGVTEVVELIINIDPGQASIAWEEEPSHAHGLPLHMILENESGTDLRILEMLYKTYPASISTPNCIGSLPLHHAVKENSLPQTVQFLLHKFPEAARTKDKNGDYPLNALCGFYYPGETELHDCEETQRLLIEACPKALSIYKYGEIYYHNLLQIAGYPRDHRILKMAYALGKKYNVFQPSEVHGLFTISRFHYDFLVNDDVDDIEDEVHDAWMDMWRETFHDGDPDTFHDVDPDTFHDEYSETKTVIRRTTLELFLCTYRNLNEANYIHGWEEALDVLQVDMDTALLQSAISRVQDDFLPYMIDKFDIDLLRPDEHGRTPLIVSIYHTVFVELDDSKNTDDEFDSDMDDSDMDDSDMDDSDMDDSDMDDSDRNIDDDKDEDEVKGLSKRLSDASMVLSCGDATYKRRDDQSLKCDVIGMMIENKEQRPTKSARTTMNITTNSNHDRAKVNAAMIRDDNGRLPLHVGAAIGLKWQNGLKTVLEAYKPAVKEADPMSGLYAFMLAATVKVGGDLTAVFSLFVEQPDVLEQIS